MIDQIKKNKIFLTLPILTAIILFSLIASEAFPQAKYQGLTNTRRNTRRGYDFYNNNGRKTGYSKVSRRGGYDYYDNKQNRLGSLKPVRRGRNTYIYYDAEGIKRGILKKNPDGTYLYKDAENAKIIESIPSIDGELGSLSPNVFQGIGE